MSFETSFYHFITLAGYMLYLLIYTHGHNGRVRSDLCNIQT